MYRLMRFTFIFLLFINIKYSHFVNKTDCNEYDSDVIKELPIPLLDGLFYVGGRLTQKSLQEVLRINIAKHSVGIYC